MTEASPARFAFVLGAMGALLAGCAQPNPDTAAADAMRPRKFRFATDSALEGTGFETSVPLLREGLLAVAERRYRTDKLDGH